MNAAHDSEVHEALRAVVSRSHGRLVASLARSGRDLSAAEDALADALREALEQWPVLGVPREPEAWLWTVSRRRLLDRARRDTVRRGAAEALLASFEREPSPLELGEVVSSDVIPDERLALLFVCAHPAIDPSVRTPLMLQTVLGLDAGKIASAFLVAPATMGQRLVRAKTKIRDAGIPFEVPVRRDWPERLGSVLEAIYAAYGAGWDELGVDARQADLSREAITLARLVVHLLPDEAEAHGLLALLLFCESRRAARRVDGRYVPLDAQEVARWDFGAIDEAFAEVDEAARRAHLGRFQLEALVQAMHARRRFGEAVDWDGLAALYAAIVRVTPTLGAHVAQAAVVGRARSPREGIALLASLAAAHPTEVARYQPYHATLAALLEAAGDGVAAAEARTRAIGLTEDPAVRAWLTRG